MASDGSGAVVMPDGGRSDQLWAPRDILNTPTAAESVDGADSGAVVVTVQNQIPGIFGLEFHCDNLAPAEVIAFLEYLDAQIMKLQGDYDKISDAIYDTLKLFGIFQLTLLGAIQGFAQQIKGSTACKDWKSAFSLSALASTATIAVLFHKFLEQFDLCKVGRQLRQERNFLLDGRLQNRGLTIYRGVSLFRAADHTEIRWWSTRAAFLVTLIAMATCFLFYTRLRCPQ